MKNTIIILIILISLLVLWFFLFFNGDKKESEIIDTPDSITENLDKAPEFSFEDYEGNTVASAYSDKKLTVVNSWTTWCPFCVDELPDLALLQEEFPDDISVIAIDRAESLSKAKKFSDDLGVTDRMTFLLDPGDSFYQSIGGFSMPETLFVGSNGEILLHKRGPLTFEQAKKIVEDLLTQASN
ncbi:MAG: TlpA disulfide reductase family protein [Candidatus Pacebacteria bacterium]|jgi:thiol-disulfide isomerase/thioredoxin|nr:hypothetical protein [bacterium]MDP6527381.1 TlpA disulfide reductase family protein [Candidatus Paceibacterota bacterium]MDP6659508.1 TlpA disulfide reductase family protein [Candidatus Paceibacterota bacterium]|tara:strand:- start:41655 stop:42206 length:552 start_codon:yes stop_codon:yes gene_type:complete